MNWQRLDDGIAVVRREKERALEVGDHARLGEMRDLEKTLLTLSMAWSAGGRELEQLRADNAKLRTTLADAVDGMEDMIGYVPDYFREKWEHDDYLARGRAALDSFGILTD